MKRLILSAAVVAGFVSGLTVVVGPLAIDSYREATSPNWRAPISTEWCAEHLPLWQKYGPPNVARTECNELIHDEMLASDRRAMERLKKAQATLDAAKAGN